MSAVLEPQAPATGAVVEKLPEMAIASLNDTVLAHYKAIEPGLEALAEKYRAVAFNVSNPKGLAEAKAGRMELRESGRYAVQRLEDRLKAQANDLKRTIASETTRLIAITKPVEDHVNGQIEAREAEIEAEKERRRQAEAARQQRHRDGISKIRSYAEAARRPDMTAERLLKGLSVLEDMPIDPAAWEEFAPEAAHVLGETIEAVKAEHAALVAKEAEAARLEFQRQEQARVAAEQAEAQRKLDEQAAALRAQQEAQAAELAAKQAEIARQAEALAELQRAAAAAEAQRQAAMAAQNTEEQRPQHVLKAEPATADATDRGTAADESPRVGAMGAGQAADAAPAGESVELMDRPWAMPVGIPVGEVIEHAEPPAPAPMVDDGREWKLGEISVLFGVTLTAAFVADLGGLPARTDKAAKLFTTSQVLDIRARLVAHLLSLEIEYSA